MTGYRKPPENGRFKKGQSGNPKGRPKSSPPRLTNSAKATLAAGAKMMTVRENGTAREIPVVEGIELAQQKSALGGSSLAQKHFLDRHRAAEIERRAEIDAEIEWGEELIAGLRWMREVAAANGKETSMPYPHPDDVIIDPERGVRFVGPTNQAEQTRLEETLRMRDLLILQYALDQRLSVWDRQADPLDQPRSALAIALYFNDHVPKRYRYDDARLSCMMMRAESRSKRDLLKAVYAGWRELGASPCRGKTLPTPRVVFQQIEAVMDAVKMLQAEASGTNK